MPDSAPQPNHILRNNLLGLLLAAVVLGLLAGVTELGSAALFAFGYVIQAAVNVVLGLFHLFQNTNQPTDKSPAPYFLSALLVLLIGFGACSGMVVLNGGLGNMH